MQNTHDIGNSCVCVRPLGAILPNVLRVEGSSFPGATMIDDRIKMNKFLYIMNKIVGFSMDIKGPQIEGVVFLSQSLFSVQEMEGIRKISKLLLLLYTISLFPSISYRKSREDN